jgi:UDP-N-acetylmuramyl tripeptide synthase
VLDRRAAIERAIRRAKPGDVVAVLGLGALGRLALDAAGTCWVHDDRKVALEACSRREQPLAPSPRACVS